VTVRGIGVDLVHLPRMREVIERWQERFLTRVFTDQEIAYCRARRDPVPHFAARFAAKEAALKALGTGLRLGIRWRELEVRRERGQAPVLVLTGRSREMLLALTHDGDYAMAQAMLVADSSSEGAAEAPSEIPGRRGPRGPLRTTPEVGCGGEAGARTAIGELDCERPSPHQPPR